jgi:hypothetical protein
MWGSPFRDPRPRRSGHGQAGGLSATLWVDRGLSFQLDLERIYATDSPTPKSITELETRNPKLATALTQRIRSDPDPRTDSLCHAVQVQKESANTRRLSERRKRRGVTKDAKKRLLPAS